jgi:simple sugar transport system ATP-binding protein
MSAVPLLAAVDVYKSYGPVTALSGVSLRVDAGKVSCLLGDNGAGKSTLIKILSGAMQPDRGTILVDGEPKNFRSPAEALDHGIATVFQDLAVVPIMPVFRNFFLGREPTVGRGPLRRFDKHTAKRVSQQELERIGIDLDDTSRPIGTLSGGERQCVAIARAVYFGAKVLILDEPTSALGVKEAAIVLRYIARARAQGVGVVFITHNVHHAYPVGDSFTILKRGHLAETVGQREISLSELMTHMAGGEEIADLADVLREESAGTARQ